MQRPVPSVWMMITVHRAGIDVQVSARGSREEQTAPHMLGPELRVAALDGFAASVRRAAARGELEKRIAAGEVRNRCFELEVEDGQRLAEEKLDERTSPGDAAGSLHILDWLYAPPPRLSTKGAPAP